MSGMLIGSQVFAGEAFWSYALRAATPAAFSGSAESAPGGVNGCCQRPANRAMPLAFGTSPTVLMLLVALLAMAMPPAGPAAVSTLREGL